MKNNTVSKTAFAVVIFAIISTLIIIAFTDGIRKLEWIDIESVAFACFGLSVLGCILGWCSFKRPLGKISAILGTVVVAGFLFQLLRGSSPAQERPIELPPKNITIPK